MAGRRELDSGFRSPRPQAPRKSARVALSGQVQLRHGGSDSYDVKIYDFSKEGCRIEFVDPPRLDETVWVKLEGLEALQATVCWIQEPAAGVEFARPIHQAVFDFLVARQREAKPKD